MFVWTNSSNSRRKLIFNTQMLREILHDGGRGWESLREKGLRAEHSGCFGLCHCRVQRVSENVQKANDGRSSTHLPARHICVFPPCVSVPPHLAGSRAGSAFLLSSLALDPHRLIYEAIWTMFLTTESSKQCAVVLEEQTQRAPARLCFHEDWHGAGKKL